MNNAQPAKVIPDNYLPFERMDRTKFTPEYEQNVRFAINTLGHNSGYDNNRLPQDHLVSIKGWFHGNTGYSAEYLWESGRQDVIAILDDLNPTPEMLERQKITIEQYTKGN